MAFVTLICNIDSRFAKLSPAEIAREITAELFAGSAASDIEVSSVGSISRQINKIIIGFTCPTVADVVELRSMARRHKISISSRGVLHTARKIGCYCTAFFID